MRWHRKKDDTVFPVEITNNHILNQGRMFHVAAIRVITERQRTEKGLRLTQFSLEHASDAVFWLDSQGRIVYANKAAWRSFERSREELLSMSIPDIDPLFPQEDWEVFCKEFKPRGSMILETKHLTKKGRDFPVEITTNYLEFDGKEYAFAFGRDITERKQAEEALCQSEAKLKEALLGAQMGVLEWTQASDTVAWDENLYRIAGRDPKLPAPSFQEQSQIFGPESWERLKSAVENALATGTPYTLDLELVRPDSSKRWAIARGGQRRDANGHLRGSAARCRTLPTVSRRRRPRAEARCGLMHWSGPSMTSCSSLTQKEPTSISGWVMNRFSPDPGLISSGILSRRS
jgi:PAS domain S-box-containing protein